MRRIRTYTSLAIALLFYADNGCAFEGRYRRLFGVPRPTTLQASSSSTRPDGGGDSNLNNHLENDDPDNLRRRNVLQSSAAALLSAFLAGGNVKPSAAASTTLILEESEKRRIDTFEKCAPSVVFIDTFTQKQDALSTNSVEVPIGTGSGFVWDKEGHIGKQTIKWR